VTGYVVVVPVVATTPMADTSPFSTVLVESGVTRASWPTDTLPMSATAMSVVT
jgi:hypothetical protein